MKFEEWLNQIEGYNSRLEKAQQELVQHRYIDNHSFWQTVLSWLKTIYNIGYEHSKAELTATIDSLKNEIRTQRKEIAALREERRLFLNQDKVPGIGWQE